jgi:hypothetical protein
MWLNIPITAANVDNFLLCIAFEKYFLKRFGGKEKMCIFAVPFGRGESSLNYWKTKVQASILIL